MDVSKTNLDAIGLFHQTDKSSIHHDYLQLYERILHSLRYEPINLIEIGVFRGSSLRTWEEYFPRANIIGVDVDPECHQYQNDRITIEIADQSDVEQLCDITRRHGPFDIVIDDGSHMWDHQITTLHYLFPHVKQGGFYILEDLDTSYGTHQPQYQNRATESPARYLQRLTDAMVGDAVIDLDKEPDDFIRSYCRRIDYILFSRRTSVIRRK